MSLNNLKTRTKILLLIIAAALVSIFLGSIGAYFLNANITESEYQKVNFIRPIISMRQLEANVWHIRAGFLEMAETQDRSKIADLAEEINKAFKTNTDILNLYAKTVSAGAEEEAASRNLLKAREAFSSRVNQALDMGKSNNPDAAEKLKTFINSDLTPVFNAYIKATDELIIIMTKNSRELDAENETEAKVVLTVIVSVIVIAVILLLIFGVFIARNITKVLNEVTDLALTMSENDLTKTLDTQILTRSDEFGNMGRAPNKMQQNLISVMKSIGSIAENIAASSEELHANADQTANASGEVANATTIMTATDKAGQEVSIATKLVENSERELKEMSQVAEEVSSTAVEASKTSQEGRDSADTAIVSINRLVMGQPK